MNEFDELRKSFSSLTDFQLALSENPEQYGAALPEITGYTYSVVLVYKSGHEKLNNL